MVSATKVPVSDSDLSRIGIELMGAAPKESLPFGDGWYNAAYGLTLEDGRRGVVKIAPPESVEIMRYEKDIMASEVKAMRLLEQLIPIPKILADDLEGRLIGRPLYIMEWLEGKPLNHCYEELGPEALGRVREEAGRIVKTVSSVRNNAFGMLAGPFFVTWKEAFCHLFDDVLSDGESKAVDLPYPLLRRVLHECQESLDAVSEPRMLHWDLWDGNIFVDALGRITGIIDFERALYGDPLMEHGFMELHPEFLSGYGASELESPNGQVRRRLYNLYLFLIMTIEGYYRHYTDPWVEQWGRAKAKEALMALGAAESEMGSLARAVLPGPWGGSAS